MLPNKAARVVLGAERKCAMGQASGCVAVVTGASRGAGKGIALALGDTGAKVYVTGRTGHDGDSALPGSVCSTADEVTRRGGIGIPVVCDHADDDAVAALFGRIADENDGQLDILVNNALTLPDALTRKGPFWSKPLSLTDLFNVGMRSTYVATHCAAQLLVKRGGGLVVNTSSFGGACYMHGPAYGAGKAAVDKMAHDMAVDFRPYGVAVVSLWMGLLMTERTRAAFADHPDAYAGLVAGAESPEFVGRVIAALAADGDLMSRSGRVLIAAELADEFGIADLDGRRPPSHRAMLGDPPAFSAAVIE